MGRKIKYTTKEQIQQANRDKRMRYYWKNQKLEQQRALKRYYENKNG